MCHCPSPSLHVQNDDAESCCRSIARLKYAESVQRAKLTGVLPSAPLRWVTGTPISEFEHGSNQRHQINSLLWQLANFKYGHDGIRGRSELRRSGFGGAVLLWSSTDDSGRFDASPPRSVSRSDCPKRLTEATSLTTPILSAIAAMNRTDDTISPEEPKLESSHGPSRRCVRSVFSSSSVD